MGNEVRPPDNQRRARKSLPGTQRDSEERVPVSLPSPPSAAAPDLESLVELVRRHNPSADVDLIRRAYNFSASLHLGQKRSSGEPYIKHPLEVAHILADY